MTSLYVTRSRDTRGHLIGDDNGLTERCLNVLKISTSANPNFRQKLTNATCQN